MRYGLAYTLISRTTAFLYRTLLHCKRAELDYIFGLLKNKKNKKIIDYGCNEGYLTNAIKKMNPMNEVCGADINEYALKSAKKRYKGIKFYKTDNVSFKKKRFDIAVISHVLEHIKEREKFMEELSQILSENNEIIIAVPQERIRGDATALTLLYNCIKLNFENPHVDKLDYNDIKDLLSKKGYKINDKIYSNYLPPFKSKKRKIHSWSLVVHASRILD